MPSVVLLALLICVSVLASAQLDDVGYGFARLACSNAFGLCSERARMAAGTALFASIYFAMRSGER
jgi:hypothetical protein